MSIATQMQRFKDIGDAIREAIHTRNNEVEVDDLKFDDFADIISTLNNINTDTYTVPEDSLLLTYDFGEYNKIRKVDIADFYQAVYDRAESAGVQKCWNNTTVVCGMSSDAWSGNKKVVRATATCNNTLGLTAKTSSNSVSVDATSVYNNGYSAGKAAGKYTRFWDSGSISVAKNKTASFSPGFYPSQVLMIWSSPNFSSTSKVNHCSLFVDYTLNKGIYCAMNAALEVSTAGLKTKYIPASSSTSWSLGSAISSSNAYYIRCFCWAQS